MLRRFSENFVPESPYIDLLIDEVFSELKSGFLELPKGKGFVEYSDFATGYELLKKATIGFTKFEPETIRSAVYDTPVALVALRAILGFTPSEWAEVATEAAGVPVTQGAARSIDRRIRIAPLVSMRHKSSITDRRIEALINAAVALLRGGIGAVDRSLVLHRLDKVDTVAGIDSVRPIADLGVPYPVLLYERFLGRPFAGHRDSVSELVGDIVESAIEDVLSRAGVSYRKTKRAERIAGFDQAPDFIIPDEFRPAVVIEAKLTEDDGTARDKIARVQRLRTLRDESGDQYQVVAGIAGRGFKVRRNDMRRLLAATDGKVFTLETIEYLASETRIKQFITRPD